MALIIAAAVGILFFLTVIYACLVTASWMDDEMRNFYQRKWEDCDGDKREKETNG